MGALFAYVAIGCGLVMAFGALSVMWFGPSVERRHELDQAPEGEQDSAD